MRLYLLCAAKESNPEAWKNLLNTLYYDEKLQKCCIDTVKNNPHIQFNPNFTDLMDNHFIDGHANHLLSHTSKNNTPRFLLSVEDATGDDSENINGKKFVLEFHYLSSYGKIHSKKLEGSQKDLEALKKHIIENAHSYSSGSKRKREEETLSHPPGLLDVKRPRISTSRKPTEEVTPLMTWASEVIKFIENYAFIFVKTNKNEEPKQDELKEPLRKYSEKTGSFLRSIGNHGKLMPKVAIEMVYFLKGLINKKAAKVSPAELEIYKGFIQYATNRANAFKTRSAGLTPLQEKNKDSCDNNAIFYKSLSKDVKYKAIPEEFVASNNNTPRCSSRPR